MKFISKDELERLKSDQKTFQLVDVRENYEFEENNIGGLNLPLGEVLENRSKISREGTVVFCCKTGKRSSAIAMTLERKYGMENLYTLEGGLTNYFGGDSQ